MRQEAARLACDVRSIKLIIPMNNSNKAIAYQINDQGRTIMKPIARHIEVFAELPGCVPRLMQPSAVWRNSVKPMTDQLRYFRM